VGHTEFSTSFRLLSRHSFLVQTVIDKLLRKQQTGPCKKRKEKAVIILYLFLDWMI
jgi:hypothetical protein